MKKLVLFMILACSVISMSAQDDMYGGNTKKKEKEKKARIWGTRKLKIEADKQEENGNRFISTSLAVFAHSNKLLNDKLESFYLSRYSIKNTTEDEAMYRLTFYMTTDTKLRMAEKSRLLVKLSDGEVLTFYLTKEIGDLENDLQVFGRSSWYNSQPSYEMKASDIKKMISGGVTKLRLETILGYIDYDQEKYSKWIFSDILKQCYEMILERAQKSNDIYEGF